MRRDIPIISVFVLIFIFISPIVLSQPGHGGNSNIPPGLEGRIEDIGGKVRTVPYKLDVMGTEYTAGQEGKLWLQLLKNHQAVDNATCYLDVYFPNNTLWMNDSLMTPAIGDNGIHYYDLNVPDKTGVYMSSATCIQPQQAFVDDFVDDSKVSEKHNIKIEDGLVKLRNHLSQQLVLTQSDFNLGIFNRTSADRDDNSGDLGIGYLNGTIGDSLVGYWRLDRNISGDGGTVIDYSGEGNDGTTNGGVTTGATGIFSTDAFDFDGSNDYISISDNIFTMQQHTVSVWVRFDNFKDYSAILRQWTNSNFNIILRANNDNTLTYALSRNGNSKVLNPSNILNTDQWYLVTAVFDTNNMMHLYLNEDEMGSLDVGGNRGISAVDDLRIMSSAEKNEFTDGSIDEVHIYNRSLSQEEIEDLYFQGMNGKFNGTYTAKLINNSETTNWQDLEINASIPTDTSLIAQFEALDSEGMVQDTQYISVNDGVQNYTLNVQESKDARLKFIGTSTNEIKTWEVNDFEIYGSPTAGYIFSEPIVLKGDNWKEFMSKYNENQGNIFFGVVEDYNTTLCDGLGDIKLCAGTIPDVKLYAKLTRNSVNLTFPQIDRWSATWEEDVKEELRGSGEMHVSESSTSENNLQEIAQEVWKRFYQLGTPPEMESTQYYCEGNKTMKIVKDMEYCEGGDCETLTLNHTKTCEYGCIEKEPGAARCRESPFFRNLMFILIFGAIITVAYIVIKNKVGSNSSSLYGGGFA